MFLFGFPEYKHWKKFADRRGTLGDVPTESLSKGGGA